MRCKRKPMLVVVVWSIIFLSAICRHWKCVSHFSHDWTQDLSWTTNDILQDSTTLADITITIKTTKQFHEKRMSALLRTWMKLALNHVRSVWLLASEVVAKSFSLAVLKVIFECIEAKGKSNPVACV